MMIRSACDVERNRKVRVVTFFCRFFVFGAFVGMTETQKHLKNATMPPSVLYIQQQEDQLLCKPTELDNLGYVHSAALKDKEKKILTVVHSAI